jgi:outer membrane protein assembly factor BamB
MNRFVLALLTPLVCLVPVFGADWFQFRGPEGNGHADAARLPTEWSTTQNIRWRTELPGKGWSSPVVSEGKIYVTTAVPGPGKGDYSLRAICIDAAGGKVLWDQEVFQEEGKNAPGIHSKNSHASPTPVIDGGLLFVHFGHMGTACLNAKDGSKVWANQSLRYTPVHGNGGSPVLTSDKVIFCIDGIEKQAVVALDRKTGQPAWQTPRNAGAKKNFSFCTPLIIKVNDREQVVAPGSDVVMSLDPADGKEIWRVKYDGYSVVPKPVYGNGLVYLSSGYDSPVLYAIKPDGKGDVTKTHVAWTAKRGAPHNPSPLVVGDAVYMNSDSGLLTCLDGATGTERWNERVGGTYSASPIFAKGNIYLLAEDGAGLVVKAGPSYELVAKNKMNERALASYGVDGDALLLRTEKALYRIEKPPAP